MNNNNEERKNNNGQGIFYAVIGIATLVVTIIGATFAYFSATTNSAANAVNTSSTTLNLGFNDHEKTGIKRNLIPVAETLTKFPATVGTGVSDCVDDNGNNICSVYQFTVTNPSTTTAQRIHVTLAPTVNTFTNLHYAVFKGNDTQIKATQNKYKVDGTAVTTVSNSTYNTIGANGDLVIADTALTYNTLTPITLAPLEQVLLPNSSVTYTIVIWLHETGKDQSDSSVPVGTTSASGNTNEAGKEFAATVNVSTSSGGAGGVTGVIN